MVQVALWALASFAALLALLTLFSAALRFGGPQARDVVRLFNKHIFNPAMMKLAGRKHWYAAVIRHKGRHSGKEYTTPVVAKPVEGGFVIPLPYGEEVDWLKNVLRAGRTVIEAKGVTYTVVEPEVIDAEVVFPLFEPHRRSTWRLFGIERFLKVKRLSNVPSDGRGGFR
jgi:hypothetical protein